MKTRPYSTSVLGTEAAKLGCVFAGMSLAKTASKMVAQDTLIVNAVMALTGVAVATLVDHPIVNNVAHGFALFGGIKALNNVAAPVAPVGVNGLGFTAPEGLRKIIADYVPNLGTVYMLPRPTETAMPGMPMASLNGVDFNALVAA